MSTEDREETFRTASPAGTRKIAAELGRRLRGGEVLALSGDLGAGKTTFVKGLCRGLGVEDTREVASPSYVLERIYAGRLRVHHFDAYRLDSADEFLALGFEEHLGSDEAILVIEWADRVASALPLERLEIDIAFPGVNDRAEAERPPHGEERTLSLSGPGGTWAAVLDELARRFVP